jgi:hypothetical protein
MEMEGGREGEGIYSQQLQLQGREEELQPLDRCSSVVLYSSLSATAAIAQCHPL